jgi:hypothetical protein
MFKENSKSAQTRHNRRTIRDEMSFNLPHWLSEGELPHNACLMCKREFDLEADDCKLWPTPQWANAMICNGCRRKHRTGVSVGEYQKLDEYLAKHKITLVMDSAGRALIPPKHRKR